MAPRRVRAAHICNALVHSLTQSDRLADGAERSSAPYSKTPPYFQPPFCMWGSRWHGSRIQHGHPGLVGMDSVSKDGVQGAALWTNPHVQATGGASRPLLSRPGGLWAWELGCGRGPSQPTPRAPRPERTCPSGPAESRNRRLIKGRCCAHNPFVSACGRWQPGRNTHKCLLVPPAHPPSPCTHPCVPGQLVALLGDLLIARCCRPQLQQLSA